MEMSAITELELHILRVLSDLRCARDSGSSFINEDIMNDCIENLEDARKKVREIFISLPEDSK